MMTADGNCIGTKHGMTFVGKWVWEMKDWIDLGFMKLFDPNYLYMDYKNKGTEFPLDNEEIFGEEKSKLEGKIGHLRAKVTAMSAAEGAALLSCGEEETEFHERFMFLMRMHTDPVLTAEVMALYNPPYY